MRAAIGQDDDDVDDDDPLVDVPGRQTWLLAGRQRSVGGLKRGPSLRYLTFLSSSPFE